MRHKHRFLLGVIHELQQAVRTSRLDLVKFIFLIAKQNPPSFKAYSFHPYKYGPWSAALYSDLAYLEREGLVEQHEHACIVTRAGKHEQYLPSEQQLFLRSLMSTFTTTTALVAFIYETYPEYTVKSELAGYSRKRVPVDNTPGHFLIGYEGIDIDEFLMKIVLGNIQVLADVRYNACSMKYDFNKERLKRTLENAGIRYWHVPELGIASDERAGLKTRDDYERVFAAYACSLPEREPFLQELARAGERQRVAIMCFEADVNSCHRREIGKYLGQKGCRVSLL